ncbi:hypothetical protein [Herbaspirillum sp. RV1423]|uniref:hypothetical protein n=1 Tax=Herbaspirillum sp. RV1423 TaxID=1443993 RepID=UPI0004B8414B|nr:hypothetical protein [Herbaspirillum sp. RV1423]
MKAPLQNHTVAKSAVSGVSADRRSGESTGFVDNRESAAVQRQLADLAKDGIRTQPHRSLADMMNDNPRTIQQRQASETIGGGAASAGNVASQDRAGVKPALQAKSGVAQLETVITHRAGSINFGGKNWAVGKKMEAKLDPFDPVKGTATGDNWTWMQSLSRTLKDKMIRGHLLNHDLGGFAVPENLYPITHRANMDHKHKVEYPLKRALQKLHEKYEDDEEGAAKDRLLYDVTVIGEVENAKFHIDAKTEEGNKPVPGVDGYDVVSTPKKKTPISKHTDPGAKVPPDWYHGDRRHGIAGVGERKEMEDEEKNGHLVFDYKENKDVDISPNVAVKYTKPEKLSEEDSEVIAEVIDAFAEYLGEEEFLADAVREQADFFSAHLENYWVKNLTAHSDEEVIEALQVEIEKAWNAKRRLRGYQRGAGRGGSKGGRLGRVGGKADRADTDADDGERKDSAGKGRGGRGGSRRGRAGKVGKVDKVDVDADADEADKIDKAVKSVRGRGGRGGRADDKADKADKGRGGARGARGGRRGSGSRRARRH